MVTLEDVNVEENPLTPAGAAALVAHMPSTVLSLQMGRCGMGDEGGLALAAVLPTLTALTTLGISDCEMSTETLCTICRALPPCVTQLYMTGNAPISGDVLDALKESGVVLSAISLGGGHLVSQEALSSLSEWVSLSQLEFLDLQSTGLETLLLNKNNFGEAHGPTVLECVGSMDNMTMLALASCGLPDRIVEVIRKHLVGLQELVGIDLSRNELSEQGLVELASFTGGGETINGVEVMPSLIHLLLDGNPGMTAEFMASPIGQTLVDSGSELEEDEYEVHESTFDTEADSIDSDIE
ncbi:hypothetical protein KIPB_001516 [Kipferlia bialata]|uniref:Uncharacterized protein n=1 Tax=Kipferlia bialata TaxID=797122 RepID=A0A9K3CQG2_9EUKA|nr:hypothetical protein KIPB_001272 [Kipferlia bialata]GIQ80682.1 hypothetical protein KIPB_001516 [Kipferlia bialata]|eukprot:g1272.t1